MCGRHRVIGLIFLSMGVGMLIVILLPWWGFILAGAMAVYGFWSFFIK